MIVHLFNSSSVSGPERLVIPALASQPGRFAVVNLLEERLAASPSSDPLTAYARSFGLVVHHVPVRRRWDRRAIQELRRLFAELAPKLVHSHGIKASVYLWAASGFRRPFPIISTHHGARGLPDWKVRLYEAFYRRFFLKRFDRVLCVSDSDREFLLGSGLSPRLLRLHRNGIDGVKTDPADRPAESRRVRALWLNGDSPHRDRLFLMGVVARLSPEKDHARLLDVLECLNRLTCEQDWRCLVFGSGALEQALRKRASRLGLDGRVRWMGYRPTIGQELSGLDLLLSFSRAEGLPINVLEAGWAGTPVLSTPAGGISELVTDADYGTWVPFNEPAPRTAARIQALLSPDGRSKLSVLGGRLQHRVQKEFTQGQWLRRLAEIYAELEIR